MRVKFLAQEDNGDIWCGSNSHLTDYKWDTLLGWTRENVENLWCVFFMFSQFPMICRTSRDFDNLWALKQHIKNTFAILDRNLLLGHNSIWALLGDFQPLIQILPLSLFMLFNIVQCFTFMMMPILYWYSTYKASYDFMNILTYKDKKITMFVCMCIVECWSPWVNVYGDEVVTGRVTETRRGGETRLSGTRVCI